MNAEAVKIFGERNCGTNALKNLIEDNSGSSILPTTEFDIDADAASRAWAIENRREFERALDAIYADVPVLSSWKHCAANFLDPSAFSGSLVLFCVRHPASWLVSLYRNPYHILTEKPATLAEFIDYQWETGARERLGGRTFRPLELYHEKLASYVGFATRLREGGIASRFVRQEDLLLRPKQIFRSLAPQLSDPRKRVRLRLTSTKRSWMPVVFVRRYYAREAWREELRGLESRVNADVDWGLAGEFGYSPVGSA